MLNVLYFFVASLKITTKLISKVLDCHDKFRFATLSDTLEPCPTGLKIFNASLNFLAYHIKINHSFNGRKQTNTRIKKAENRN